MIRLGILLTLCLTFAAQAATTARSSTRPAAAALIMLDGEINDYSRDVLFQRFAKAREAGAQTIILQIDTYGGLVTAGLEISQYIKQQPLHTIAYVPRKAISAGAMIALACDELYMAPHAHIGDAAPIAMAPGGGPSSLGATERAKAESPILEDFRDSALRNGYDPLLAEAMVTIGREVYWVQDAAGLRRFVDAKTYEALLKEGWSAVPGVRSPLDSAESLLTLSAEVARKVGLARGLAGSADALADELGLQIRMVLSPTAGDKLIAFLASNTVRFFLLTIFSIAAYAALHAPGHGFAEVIAVVTLALLAGVPLLTGYAQWWEIVAILAGIALVAVELFVLPGFGVAGVSGIVLLLGGLLLTFVPLEPSGIPGILPALRGTWDALTRGVMVIVAGLSCSILLWFWLSRYLPTLPYFNRLILSATVGGDEQTTPPPAPSAQWPAVGQRGQVVTDLRPGGAAAFHDPVLGDRRNTDVISDSGFVAAGDAVIVREIHGNQIIVRKA